MTRKVVQLQRIGEVTLSKNFHSKNIKISVKPDKKILVSFPYFVSSREVLTFVQKNEAWILEQQVKFQAKKKNITSGSKITTKLHVVDFQIGKENKVNLFNEKVTIILKDFDSEESRNYTENVLAEIYRLEAKIILPPRLKTLATQCGFCYNRVTIRNNRRNWGSCSAKNNISLNLQMMKLPDELIDYILLHELVHTEIKNHGPHFWKRLDEYTNSNAKELAKKVRQYSTYAF